MSPENKQRVVGVVVLVAFIALLVPFLFTSGTKNKEQTENVNETPSVPVTEVNAETPNPGLGNETTTGNVSLPPPPSTIPTTATLPKELPKELLKESPEVPKEIVNIPVTTTVDANKKTVEPAVKTGLEANIAPPVSKEMNEGAAAESTATSTAPKSSVLAAKPAAKKTGATNKKDGKVYWSVQVGSFSNEKRMQNMVSKLQSSGFKVYLQKISTTKGLMIRVLVGRETTQAKAEKILEKIKKRLKITGRVISNKK